MNEKISVIIPCYNRAQYIPSAIESVFRQSCGNIEIILVDDSSTDNSCERAQARWEELCKQACKELRNKRVLRIHSIPHCGMPGRVRNTGVELSSNEIIAFLDSDDLWIENKLEHQLSLHEECELSHTRERWLRARSGEGTKEMSQKAMKHQRSGNIFADALWKCIIGPSTVVLNRSLFNRIGRFREDLCIAEDYELWLRITAGVNIAYIDTPLVEKRAGMPDQNQLSASFAFIEPFRVRALYDLLKSPHSEFFTAAQQEEAWAVLMQKLEIVRIGAKKRNVFLHGMYDTLKYCEEKTMSRNK